MKHLLKNFKLFENIALIEFKFDINVSLIKFES